jgi:hypothetical protein
MVSRSKVVLAAVVFAVVSMAGALVALPDPACPAQPREPREPGNNPLRVLFVGNSYTYENNLPFVFRSLVQPTRGVEVTMLAEGGATLRRHIDRGELLKKIADRQFDVVVLQEQSVLCRLRLFDGLALIQDPAAYHRAVREVATAARTGNARLVLFATWPRAETPRYLAALHNANVAIAKETGATVAPVGLVWDRLGGDTCESLHLYGPDGSHPAPEGTYVAAVVLARAVLGKVPPLKSVPKVPLMDGRAQLSGSFTDIAPTAKGTAALEKAMEAVYKLAPDELFPTLPAAPPVPEPALPPELVRGRLSSSFLRGQWQGEFATFGFDERAKILLDLRAEQPTVRMTHASQGWSPGEDDVTARISGPDAEGVITLTYSSKGKKCTVEVKLVRVGDQLRGLVRFITEGDHEWVRSTIALSRK